MTVSGQPGFGDAAPPVGARSSQTVSRSHGFKSLNYRPPGRRIEGQKPTGLRMQPLLGTQVNSCNRTDQATESPLCSCCGFGWLFRLALRTKYPGDDPPQGNLSCLQRFDFRCPPRRSLPAQSLRGRQNTRERRSKLRQYPRNGCSRRSELVM